MSGFAKQLFSYFLHLQCSMRVIALRTVLPLLLVLCFAQQVVAASLSNGLSFLSQAQNPDGTWGNRELTGFRDTTTVLDTLTLLGQTSSDYLQGEASLNNTQAFNHDALARQVVVLTKAGARMDALVTRLLEAQNPEITDPAQPDFPGRGWGIDNHFATSILDTALVLRALQTAGSAGGLAVVGETVAPGASSPEHPFTVPPGATHLFVSVRATTGTIRVLMKPPGGGTSFVDVAPGNVPVRVGPFAQIAGEWHLQVNNTGATNVTYTLEVGFTRTDGFDVFRITTPLVYLGLAQNLDGGWGIAPGEASQLMITAETLTTLQAYADSFPSQAVLNRGITWLASRQNPDGGFGEPGASTVYETALASRVIALASPNHPALAAASAFLGSAQAGNGSWNDAPYDTALAMQALVAATPLAAPTITTNGGAGPGKDFIIDTATVVIQGLVPIGTRDIQINAPSASVQVDSLTGRFTATLTLREGANPLSFVPVNGFGQPGAAGTLNVTLNSTLIGQNLTLLQGLNLVGLQLNPVNVTNAADLLAYLGPQARQIQRLDRATGRFLTLVRNDQGGFSGTNFALNGLDGLSLTLSDGSNVRLVGSPPASSTVDLLAGLNVLTIPNPPADLTAFKLLTLIGDASIVSAIQRFEPQTGRFETATYADNGQAAGSDFPVTAGNAYLVSMRADRLGFKLPVGITVKVTITQPSNGAVVTVTPAPVSGTVTGEAPISVTVNGVAATVQGTTFSAAVPLTPGPNTLTATATDAGKRTGSNAITVTFTPVDFHLPVNGSVTGARTFSGAAALLNQAASFTETQLNVPVGVSYTTTGVSRISATDIRVSFTIAANAAATPGIYEFQVVYGLLDANSNPLEPLIGNAFNFRIEVTR